eukprot:TRINITY_DN2910_c0_g1_i4.p1 TRINITY_DN2910_c0_g1~~TRINITY_DN2910_c0_g1_i4.p1  ORF type:complete len:394 (-),score=34.69 TRINITY_DN2910_c0_g1_i4:3013-4074(-)
MLRFFSQSSFQLVIVCATVLFRVSTSLGNGEILMITKHKDGGQVSISTMTEDWIHSEGYVGVQHSFTSRKLQQNDQTGETIILEQMIGNDTTRAILQTQEYPWRAIGHLEARRPGLGWEQSSGRCTGAMIGPRHVLTAAHCLWDIETNSWYEEFRFIPGRVGNDMPYGVVGWANASIPVGWDNQVKTHDKYDYGVLELDEDVGQTVGWFSYGFNCSEFFYRLNIAGYPGDRREGNYMYYTYCQSIYLDACLSGGAADLYKHQCDTAAGMSGGPMWTLNPATQIREIRGIHKGATGQTNLGIYISKNLYTFVEERLSIASGEESRTEIETVDVAKAADIPPILEEQAVIDGSSN